MEIGSGGDSRDFLAKHSASLFVLLLATAAIGGYGLFAYNTLAREMLVAQIARQEEMVVLQQTITSLEKHLAEIESQNNLLTSDLNQERGKNDIFEEKIDDLSSTVGVLDKLSKTDKELLEKYSKVYFLNEHYLPASLTDIPLEYVYDEEKSEQIQTGVWSHLERLLKAALADNLDLKIISSYRSFGTQTTLKSSYRVTYGAGTANQFSADQGYSEHQLGTTVDFTTTIIGATFAGFDKTNEYKWLVDNGYRYGFILSYPPGNKYYQFEPWHWRFVGVKLAKEIQDHALNFYDLDQRFIDQYLIYLFDQS